MKRLIKKQLLPMILCFAVLLSTFSGSITVLATNTYKTFFEAEEAEAADSATWTAANDADASNGKVATNTKGQAFVVKNVAESNQVLMKYSGTISGSATVSIEESGSGWRTLGSITFATTQDTSMKRGKEVALKGVYIPAGSNIKIIPQCETNIDYFKFDNSPLNSESELAPTVLLAKNGENKAGAVTVTEIMSTVGEAVKLSGENASVTITVPGTVDCESVNSFNLRYYSPDGAAVELTVDGNKKTVDLAACSYHAYSTAAGMKNIKFSVGSVITIALKSGLAYIDCIELIDLLVADDSRVIAMPNESGARAQTSLDGVWLSTKTKGVTPSASVKVPESFEYTAPVPGLWDMATPSLGDHSSADMWYQTTITMPSDYTANSGYCVELQINKAQWGRSIYVNGVFAGHYAWNWSASNTDISSYLHAGENTISIMLGYWGGPQYSSSIDPARGKDPERVNYYPGITDSVSVIVNKIPQVDTVQTSADIYNGTVKVQTRLSNSSASAVTTDVTVNIYELGIVTNGVPAMNKLVGTYTESNVSVSASGTYTLNIESIAIDGYDYATKTWWPENPYLYQIEIKTSGDTYTRRFAMKTFNFDPDTKEPMLNGKIYRLLGTNVVMGRFYDDPNHEDYAWDEQWVRQLYTTFRETNWEVYRSHVGPVPDMWYDLADEMGMMIVDEYGYWYDDWCTYNTMLTEIKTIIDQRQTHPSIIYWDAQNETAQRNVTTNTIKWVLENNYDISARNWDNGYCLPVDQNQPTEYHPYPFWGMTSLNAIVSLNTMSNKYPTNGGENKSESAPNPIIINEYAELWLDREGNPTSISKSSYNALMPDATSEERLEWYSEFIAMLTEFWRAGRNIAGIQYFSGLAYSKPDAKGATGDLLLPDISTPQVRPEVQNRVKNAFSKLGICIEKYNVSALPGLDFDFPVTLINDNGYAVNDLPVTLTITCNGRVLLSETEMYDLAAVGDDNGNDLVTKEFSFITPSNLSNGDVVIVTASYTLDGETVESVRKLTCTGFDDETEQETEEVCSTGKSVKASGYEASWAVASNAVDGNIDDNHRWSATNDHSAWITVDLGIAKELTKIKLYWTSYSYGKEYKIQISDDGVNYEDAVVVTDGTGTTATFDFPEGTIARYVKMQGVKYMGYGYSLKELEVYSKKVPSELYSTGKPAETNSTTAWWGAASNATDGVYDSNHRWCAKDGVNDAWITVDLVTVKEIVKVELAWTTYAYGKEYKIQISDDNVNFTDVVHVTNGVGGNVAFDFPAGTKARYVRMQGIKCESCYSLFEFDVYVKKVNSLLYSTGKPAETNSITAWWGAASNATDGVYDSNHRWCSADGVEDAWLTVDLEVVKEIAKVELAWTTYAYGKEYKIQVSDDNVNFTDVVHITNGGGGTSSFDLPEGTKARYVRMQGIKSNSCYSLFEFNVYITVPNIYVAFEGVSLNKSELALEVNSSKSKESAQLLASTAPLNATNIKSLVWSSSNPAVAQVSTDGVVTAVSHGSAVVTYTVTTSDNRTHTISCNVTVSGPYNIALTSGDGYWLKAADGFSSPVDEGESFSFTLTLAKNCVKLDNFAVKANGVVLNETDGVYTISNISQNQTVTVEGLVTYITGDVNSDGVIDSVDLLTLQQYMLGIISLESVYPADIDNNKTIDSNDLLILQLYLLGMATI